jgi:hypothetical protein
MLGSSPLADTPLAGQESQAQAATPVHSPTTGVFVGSTSVTLSTTTPGASIYYTTDGSTPDSGDTLYSGAISIITTTTIKAIAIASGYTDSAVSSETYTITDDLNKDNGRFDSVFSSRNSIFSRRNPYISGE